MPDQETIEKHKQEREERRRKNAATRSRYRKRRREKDRAAREASGAPAPAPEAKEHGPGRPKVRQGVVTSDKGEKTITVRVDITRRHKRYHKILRSSITLHVHDERNDAHAGDTVRVQECRPMSRTKRWRLLEVLERAR
jgi:small subunit ribosomal protein S17